MRSMYSIALEEFHAVFADPKTNSPDLRPALHEEEHEELMEALDCYDKTAIAKELADVLYICFGTAEILGIDLDLAFSIVHNSNMSKASICERCKGSGVDGFEFDVKCGICKGAGKTVARREDGKVLKPDTYVAPDVSEAVNG